MWLKLKVITLDNDVEEQLINMDKALIISKCPEGSLIILENEKYHIKVRQLMHDVAMMLNIVGRHDKWSGDY